MINIVLEIQKKIRDFELQTGFKPNLLVLGQNHKKAMNTFLKFNSAIIEYYPDVFTLPMRFTKHHKNIELSLSIS